MAPYSIRVVGDPVLRQRAAEVTTIDGRLAKLADDMIATMYDAPGVGLAAPQVGVEKRMFVYDVGEGPFTVVNPEIVETDGEWAHEEGCLSVPGLSWEIIRAKRVHLAGVDLDGNDLSIEADELLARCFQHELDHLDGVLLLERLDPDTRKQALKTIRELGIGPSVRAGTGAAGGGFSLR
jgi:peptide deformylase